MKSKCFLVFAIISMVILLSGCQENMQLHERLIVQGIGIDHKDDNYLITMHIFDATKSNKEEEGKTEVISGTGSSVFSALSNINKKTGMSALYSQNLIVVVGSEAAKSGMGNIIDFFIRYYEARPSVSIFVSKTTASEVLNCKLSDELISAKDIAELSNVQTLNSSSATCSILKFVSNLKSHDAQAHCMAISVDGDDDNKVVKADGTAVFNRDKLVGYLSEDETRGFLLITDKVKGGTETVKAQDIGDLTYLLKSTSSKVKVDIQDDVPVFDINIDVRADIYEIDNSIYKTLDSDYFEVLQGNLERRLLDLSSQAISSSIIGHNSDVFRFKRYLLKQQTQFYKNHSEEDLLKKSKFNIGIKVTIDNTGQEANPV